MYVYIHVAVAHAQPAALHRERPIVAERPITIEIVAIIVIVVIIVL